MNDKSEEIRLADAFFEAARNQGDVKAAYRAYKDYISTLTDKNEYLENNVETWYRKLKLK